MNQVAPPKSTEAGTQAKPSMNDALEDIFATSHQRGFAEKLAGFAQVLTNAHWACCIIAEPEADPMVLAGQLPENQADAVMAPAEELLSDTAAKAALTLSRPPLILSRIAMPDGTLAVLALGFPQGNKVQLALNYERAVFLATLTFARNKPLDRTRHDQLVSLVQAAAQDPATDLTALVNTLAAQTGASYAAAAYWTQGSVQGLQISGQDKAAKRAILPDTLRRDMRNTAAQRLMNAERSLATAQDQSDGLILHLENPTRNLGTVPGLSAIYAMVQKTHKRRWITQARLTKAAVGLLVLVGVGLIPLPDGVELPALVEAQTQRVVTAPVTAILDEVFVSDGDRVAAIGDALVTLNNTEIQAELIGIRAEQAKALLERESARAARNPAALRNAELEVERLKSRIELLEFRSRNARIVAPITGLVMAPDLKERQGTTVRQGEDLLTIADPSQLRLKLSIPETQIGKLQDGATGIFRPDYDPTLRIEGAITLISSAKTGEGTEQMFLGRARLDGPQDGLRPGLNGVLSVQRDAKPLALILYEAVRNYVLLRLWL